MAKGGHEGRLAGAEMRAGEKAIFNILSG